MLNPENTTTEITTLSRRTLVAGAAWAVPTVMVVGAAPAMAASRHAQVVAFPGNAANRAGSSWTNLGNLSDTPSDAYAEAAMQSNAKGNTWTFDAGTFGFNLPLTAVNVSLGIEIRYRTTLTGTLDKLTVTPVGRPSSEPPLTADFTTFAINFPHSTRDEVNAMSIAISSYHTSSPSNADNITFIVDYIKVTVDYDY